jgi:ketosteroid isomerase-like protein
LLASGLIFAVAETAGAHDTNAASIPFTTAGTANASYASLKQQVTDSEIAFAATMKDRDHAALAKFVAEDAIFFTDTGTLRGREEILQAWRKYYEGRKAPFSWGPDQVEVFPSGKLAYSGGTVMDPSGKAIARFSSIWRLEASGQWKIIFDRGEPLPHKAAP